MNADASDRDANGGGSFDDFVAARGPALWRTAWLLTGDSRQAEDLVQTALGKAWPHWRRVSVTGSFETYTRKIMLTTYLAWWRRHRDGERPAADPPETTLAEALRALTRSERAVVVLRYYEDLSEAMVAELLGISVGSVRSQTARALAALRASSALVVGGEVAP